LIVDLHTIGDAVRVETRGRTLRLTGPALFQLPSSIKVRAPAPVQPVVERNRFAVEADRRAFASFR
jgi:hypothetical protein